MATRTYTLSVAPSDHIYRISVKRDGVVSQWLHDHIKVGDLIEARAPAGAFTIDPGQERPAVLLGAGIGITPMLAMLKHVVYEGLRKQKVRLAVLVQSARSKKDRAFMQELEELEEKAGGAAAARRACAALVCAERWRIAGFVDDWRLAADGRSAEGSRACDQMAAFQGG